MKKHLVITIVFVLQLSYAIAQDRDPDYTELQGKGMSLYNYLNSRFRQYQGLDTFGVKGYCWVKFQVDTFGTPKNLMVSSGATQRIAAFLRKQLEQTEKSWPIKKVDGKKVESGLLVLPIRYVYYLQGSTLFKNIEADMRDLGDFFNANSRYKEKVTFLPAIILHSGVE
ncbi:MAG: hypothetical protein EOO10_23695 [Chitinophagaceae bacterium]|nr:MAG: hypothetical protein EOO10_23695 [Chitinophagaceae bacterium]